MYPYMQLDSFIWLEINAFCSKRKFFCLEGFVPSPLQSRYPIQIIALSRMDRTIERKVWHNHLYIP